MPTRVFHQLYYHVVWATYRRSALIVDEVQPWLVKQVAREAEKRGATVLACNAMPDHIHLLISVAPGDISQFVGQIKGATSFKFNREFGPKHQLKWQDGYGIVTLRSADTARVIRYIENQAAIHAARTNGSSNILENVGQPSAEGSDNLSPDEEPDSALQGA